MIVIGAGRVGQGLAQLDSKLRLIDRTKGWEALDEAAGEVIVLAVRNDDLSSVIDRVPPHRRGDLVFTQNGMLRGYLDSVGLLRATRGLFFFAVAKRGDKPVPGSPSPFFGPQADELVGWMRSNGLAARALDSQAFTALELEKLIWNCAFGLMCEVHDCDVGRVVTSHRGELHELVRELQRVGESSLEIELDTQALVDRLCAYSESIADYRGAVKEWTWRNGWFVDEAERQAQATPLHRELLAKVGRGAQGIGEVNS